MAQASNREEADQFGRTYLPEFSGNIIEVDPDVHADAEEFWGVETIRVMREVLNPSLSRARETQKQPTMLPLTSWVAGLELPEEVESADLLTADDRKALALDHIERVCKFVGKIEIRTRV